jgi:plastocyanin
MKTKLLTLLILAALFSTACMVFSAPTPKPVIQRPTSISATQVVPTLAASATQAPTLTTVATKAPILAASATKAPILAASATQAPTLTTAATKAPTLTTAAPSNQEITISGFKFDPASVTVAIGTTVTWTNQDSSNHTVVADDGSWKSDSLAKGASFSYTFDKAGTYTYICSVHPAMTGTIIVK